MSNELLLVLVLLAAAILMFALNRPRMDAVGLIMMTVLPFTGVITVNQAIAGFSDSSIVLLGALFVVGEGLMRTGVAQRLGDWLIATAGSSDTRLLVLMMAAVAGLGAFMSSTGVVAIFIPVALRIAQTTGAAPRSLMMPLSFAALISGMLTLIATAPNLVINSELARHGLAGFRFFSFTPFGLPVLAMGIFYMRFARRWLAARGPETGGESQRPTLAQWIDKYGLADREYRVRVTERSPLAGKTLDELDLRGTAGVNIVAIERSRRLGREVMRPAAKLELRPDDVLLIDLFRPTIDVEALRRQYALELLPLTGAYFSDRSQEIGMAEVMVAADSALVGKTLAEARFRTRFGLTAIGLRHGSVAHAGPILSERLRVGDTLLVVGAWKDIERLRADTDDLLVLSLPAEIAEVLPAPGKVPQALFCLLLMVGLMVSGVVPNVQAALIACLLMGALGCVDLDSAYRSIHWKSLVLIVGMLPFSIALQKTGGVDLAADGLTALTAGAGSLVVLASLFAITALLGLFISNTATAVLMAPVALAIAKDLHASPYPFAMTVALAASTAFMTPISSPVNTLVVGPGNYAFGDFVRVGVPFSVLRDDREVLWSAGCCHLTRSRGGPGPWSQTGRIPSHCGLRDEQVEPEALGQVPGDELPLDAVPGLVEPRTERPQPALARRDRDDAAADAALPRQPDLVQPVSRRLVEPGRRHHRQRIVTDHGVHHPFPGDRIHAAGGQGRAHDRQVPGAHVQRALLRIEVHRRGRVHVDPSVVLEQAGDALVPVVGLGGGGIHLVIQRQPPPGEAREPVMDEPPLRGEAPARREAGCRDGPRVHHRVRPAAGAPLDALERIEREPGGVHAHVLPDLLDTECLGHQREHERLRDAHDRELAPASPTAYTSPAVLATQMPRRSLGTRERRYTCEPPPSVFDLKCS